MCFPIAEGFGRRIALSIASFFFLLGAGIMLVSDATFTLDAIYAGRVLGGIGVVR